MADNNKVTLVGKISRFQEGEITTKSGEKMKALRFTMEIKRAGGKYPDYPRVRMIGKMAENFLARHKEGDKAVINGVIETSSYEKDGKPVYVTEVFATSWEKADELAQDKNVVILLGNLTRDPDNYNKVKAFFLAVTRERNRDKADFPRIVLFEDAKKSLEKYLQEIKKDDLNKGDTVSVEGHIQTGSYDKDGQKVYTTDISVPDSDKVSFVRAAGSGKRTESSDSGSAPEAEPAPAPQQDSWESLEEDVPF